MEILSNPEYLVALAGVALLALLIGVYISRRAYRRAGREEAELNLAVFEQVSEGIFLFDAETKNITQANASFCSSLGYEAGELRGLSVYDLVTDGREGVDEDAKAAVEKGRHAVGERVYRRKDGTLVSFEVSASRVRSAGRLTVCVVARDTTESRATEERLRESEERYQGLVERMPAIVYLEDFETGATLYDSPRIEDILGYPANTFETDPHYRRDILHPEDRERVMQARKDRVGEESSLIEYRVMSRDRDVVWVRDEAWLVKDDEGNPRFWRGIVFDITGRKAAEERLCEIEDRYRSLVQLSPGAVAVQQGGNFVYINEAGGDILDGEKVTGSPTLGFVHPDDRRTVRDRMRKVERGERPDPVELTLLRADGTPFYAELASAPVRYRGKPAEQIVFRDITGRKAAEREASRQRAELIRSNSELERFAYMVAHDLRAPLKELGDLSGALLGRESNAASPAEDREYLVRIGDSVRRMDRMIGELLDLARLTRSPMNSEEVDLSEIARSVASSLRLRNPDRRAEVIVAGGLNAEGDRELLATAVHNLMENAWKFTGRSPRPRIVFGMIERDGEPVYFVRDNGVGFDMAHAGKLFAPFQTLHPEGDFDGPGVGLAAVARVIERHGGRIWAEGEVDRGATFYFTL